MQRRGLLCVLAVLLGSVAGCASLNEPHWQKMGVDYTTAEFNRDRDACTKDKKLDHECMKAKGWIPVSPDRPPAASTPTPTPSRY